MRVQAPKDNGAAAAFDEEKQRLAALKRRAAQSRGGSSSDDRTEMSFIAQSRCGKPNAELKWRERTMSTSALLERAARRLDSSYCGSRKRNDLA